jgi:capsular exopolysaccharide synthesis family protein
MDRIQKALDLSRSQQRPQAVPAEDHRIEREALAREFSQVAVEFETRLALDWPALRQRRVISADDNHAAGHAYRMLRTQVLHRARANGLNVIGIASACNGEGKTLTAVNLALSLAAEPNQRVLLIDLDLRRPSVAETLGLAGVERGLESWFNGDQPLKRVCYGIEGIERLFVLPTLAPVLGSSEVLANIATRRLINDLKDRDPGRILIVDLPPVLLSDDALIMAPLLDGVVLVVNERRSKREDVTRVIELLHNTKIVGTVLNRSSESEQRAY